MRTFTNPPTSSAYSIVRNPKIIIQTVYIRPANSTYLKGRRVHMDPVFVATTTTTFQLLHSLFSQSTTTFSTDKNIMHRCPLILSHVFNACFFNDCSILHSLNNQYKNPYLRAHKFTCTNQYYCVTSHSNTSQQNIWCFTFQAL